VAGALGLLGALARSPLCPPWGRSLGPDDVDAVVAWLEVVSRPAAEPGADAPPDVPGR